MADITHIFAGGFNAGRYAPDSSISNSPLEQFRGVLFDAGLIVESINPDGRIHRVPTRDDKGQKASGWYIYFDDPKIPAGAYGDWRSNDGATWSSIEYKELTEEQKAWHNQRIQQAKEARQIEQDKVYKSAALEALKIWKSARACEPTHPYLVKKGVKAFGIRQLEDGRLIVPVSGEGGLQSLQYINQRGEKLFLSGGKASGGYHEIGDYRGTTYIAEGYATAATIFAATGHHVAIAFNAGNIKAVAKAMRDKHPNARIIIAADDDQFTDGNPGLSKANEAAKMVGASVMAPHFEDLSGQPTDFNDLMIACGLDEVKKQLGVGQPSRIGIRPISEIEFSQEPIDWLIKGYIESRSLTCLYARPATYKTFVMLDWSLCLASGIDWAGHKVKRKANVVYINGEGQRGMLRRIQAWCIHNHVDHQSINFSLSTNAASLFTDPNELMADLTNLNTKIDLIVFDTLSRNTPGMEENATKDMSIVVSHIQDIQRKFDCAAAVLHHTPKSDPTSLRGSGALEGAIDGGFFLEKQESNPTVRLACGKMKDSEPPEDIYIEPLSIDLGYEDEDGKQVNSLVIQQIDPTKNKSLVEGMRDKRIRKDIIEFLDKSYQALLNVSDSPRGNYLPKLLAKRLSGRKGGNWSSSQIEITMHKMMDNEEIIMVEGHNKSRGKTMKTNIKNEEKA